MKGRVVIGANFGDEGKGTVVAKYTKQSDNVVNVLTNGGAQRGHSILTKDGSVTFQHFGSGTYYGADTYYSRYFIINPMQFVAEYEKLLVKPSMIFRDWWCRWSTPYDSMANLISEQQKGRHASCCMGIWNTIKRTKELGFMPFDNFLAYNLGGQLEYLKKVREYYEKNLTIPESWKSIWSDPMIATHFISDCKFMNSHTVSANLSNLREYDNLIFENGQGLLLCDTGKDTYDTTPSNTGIEYAKHMLKELGVDDITAHYVTRPYLTRHGDGYLFNESARGFISSGVEEDRTNHYNEGQGEFRYGLLDIGNLSERVVKDAGDIKFEIELTHCDEMDRVSEFRKVFGHVNTYDSPLV